MPHPETLPTTVSRHYLELPPDAQEALSATVLEQPVLAAISLHEQVILAIARQDAEAQGNAPDALATETPPLPEHPTLRTRLATTRLGRLAAKAALVTIGFLGGVTAVATPAHAETTHTYTVTGTGGEGVWLHGDPGLGDTGDLIKIMPEGSRFTADCYVNDTPIGPRNNPVWLHGKDQAGTTGYFTDYYSSSKWSRNDKSGLPPVCGTQQAQVGQPKQGGSVDVPKSVFYSPLVPPTGLREIDPKDLADINKSVNEWSSGDCSPDKVLGGIPSTVDTIATWSLARMTIPYYLEKADSDRYENLDTIVMFDPGASSDMDKPNLLKKALRKDEPCDWRYDINGALSKWLGSDKDNRLVIVTGRDTEMKADGNNPNSKSTFKGLWDHYLAGIWNKPFANRATVCDYNNMSHKDILTEFAGMVENPRAGCMPASKGVRLTVWHP